MARGIVPFPFDVRSAKTLQTITDIKRDDTYPRGVFAEFPAATPKWTRPGTHTSDFRHSMARMFLQLEAKELKRFLDSVDKNAADAGESKILASVLAGSDGEVSGTGYIDFLMQRADHSFQEKSQVVETLADNYVIYYFGAAAVPFTYSGTVLNTVEDDQGINMLRIYRDMIRGTQLARRRKLVRLRYNGMIVAGSIMGLQLGLEADSEMAMSFSFQLMPKTVTLLPSLDFGVVSFKDGISDPSFNPTVDAGTNVGGARLLSNAPAVTLSGGATAEPTVEENEAGQSASSGQRLDTSTSDISRVGSP